MSIDVSDILNPSLLSEVKRLEFRTRRSVDADVLGSYKSAFRGQGLIFSDVREYQPGDDIRSIHWKITARTGKVYVKDFEEDRQLTIVVAVDISRSTVFGTEKSNQSRMIEFAALILLLARQNNDKVGLCLFDDEVRTYIPPSQSGRNQFQRLLYALVKPHNPRPATNVGNAVEYIASHQKKRAVVFLLSDFHCSAFDDELRKLSIRHDTICAHAIDNAEISPPSIGLVRVVDSESGSVRTVDLSAKSSVKDFGIIHSQRSAYLRNCCRLANADYITVTSNPMRSLATLMRERTARRR